MTQFQEDRIIEKCKSTSRLGLYLLVIAVWIKACDIESDVMDIKSTVESMQPKSGVTQIPAFKEPDCSSSTNLPAYMVNEQPAK